MLWAAYLAEHAFVGDDSHRKEIRCEGVVLSVDHFGRHVPRSATRVPIVIVAMNASHSQVSDSQIAFVVNH